MMEKDKKYLYDIFNAIELIDEFMKEINSFNGYEKDQKTQSAVERQLGIIGEAVNQYNKLSINLLSYSKEIIGFRNRIIHAYDSIDNSIVWVIIKKYLPELRTEVQSLINYKN